MKQFPKEISVDKKSNFGAIHYQNCLCKLRADIYDHMIKEVRIDENNFFDVDNWGRQHLEAEKEKILPKLVGAIMSELENRGWKCKLTYGGTGLFIYSSEKPPRSCYDDEL